MTTARYTNAEQELIIPLLRQWEKILELQELIIMRLGMVHLGLKPLMGIPSRRDGGGTGASLHKCSNFWRC